LGPPETQALALSSHLRQRSLVDRSCGGRLKEKPRNGMPILVPSLEIYRFQREQLLALGATNELRESKHDFSVKTRAAGSRSDHAMKVLRHGRCVDR
jgi:hypothetical protein